MNEEDGAGEGRQPPPWEPDRELVFYYNRERRLERASPAVRALYESPPLVKGGIIRSLTSTRSNTLLLITILIIMAFIMVFSALTGAPRGAVTLGGAVLRVSAGTADGESFVGIRKTLTPGETAPYTGEVFVGVSPLLRPAGKLNPADIPVFTARVFFSLAPEEEYRLTLPFDAETVLLLLQAGEERAVLRVTVT